MHFFSPANVMKLCEIVRADKTAPDALTTAVSIARKIAKVPAVVGVCDGFVGNRMDWTAQIAPSYFNNRKVSIYGGSNEIQRNIIAKAVLGL